MLLDLLSEKTREPAECLIHVNGKEIDDLYPFLVEARVEASRSEAAAATLKFETRRDEMGAWLVQDAGILEPWAPIVIEAAFGERTEEVMRGYIREVNAEYPEDAGTAALLVECQDDSIRLDRTHQRITWGSEELPSSDSLILNTILTAYGLTAHPESGQGQSQVIALAQDDTDIKFLKKRAEFNGYELIFSEGSIYFGPMRLEADAQETIMVYAGKETNCLNIKVNGDGHQADAVAFDVPDEEGDGSTEQIVYPDLPLLGLEHASSAGSGLEPFVWKMSGSSGADTERLNAQAQQKANDLDIHRVQAEGELDGTLYGHVLRVGLPVPVDGLGSRLSGIYYVDKVSHSFTYEGYKQQFTLLRNAYGDNLDDVLGLGSVLSGVL
jgi:hypothetical protein